MSKTKEFKTIEITPDTRILFETDNYTIQRKYKKTWKSESFYPNLESLFIEQLETLPGSSQKLTGEITSILEAINEAKKIIVKTIKKI
jgi:hypothetical protein